MNDHTMQKKENSLSASLILAVINLVLCPRNYREWEGTERPFGRVDSGWWKERPSDAWMVDSGWWMVDGGRQ